MTATRQKFNHPEGRQWLPVDVRGTTMDKCILWKAGMTPVQVCSAC